MINKVTLVGRLGKSPEVRNFDGGGKICNFTLATDESYKNKEGQKVEQTEWHNVVIQFDNLVDIAEKYLEKGMLVYLEGKIRTRSWEKNGEKRYTTEVVCNSFKMLSGKGESERQAVSAQSASGGDDNLPF